MPFKNARSVIYSLVFVFLLSGMPYASALVGSSSIYAPAVLSNLNKGVLTLISLNVTRGNGTVSITGPQGVGISTLTSAEIAASYASSYLSLNHSKYNFTYHINDSRANVSGPSGGLAFTLLAISALQGKPLLDNFTVTGTISPNGDVGEVGGVYDKAMVASQYHMGFFIVPYASNQSFEYYLYYIIQSKSNMPIVFANNVSDAIQYAFGNKAPNKFVFNQYTNYYLDNLTSSNVSCSSCNLSSFANIVNFTFNFTNAKIDGLGVNYPDAKANLGRSLAQAEEISSKGYAYTGADFGFLTYLKAFLLSNSGAVTEEDALHVLLNVSSFCSSFQMPQMNQNNYEYVLGGRIRHDWANVTLDNAMQSLNSSNLTSDGMLSSVYAAGSAYGWCLASQEMYSIASSINGTPMTTTPIFNSNVKRLVKQQISKVGGSLYTSAAMQEINSSMYAAAMYNLEYSKAFDNPLISGNATKVKSEVDANIANGTFGIWPAEFSASAKFFVNEADLPQNSNQSMSMLYTAYTTSLLASGLSYANKLVSSSLVAMQPGAISSAQLNNIQAQLGNLTADASNLNSQVTSIYSSLIIISVMLFVILIILLYIMLKLGPGMPPAGDVHAKRRIRK